MCRSYKAVACRAAHGQEAENLENTAQVLGVEVTRQHHELLARAHLLVASRRVMGSCGSNSSSDSCNSSSRSSASSSRVRVTPTPRVACTRSPGGGIEACYE